ncbi:serine hydrolase domain-containing protein [Paenibacillus alkalitolerans]|uniref:serine hydrolase domain-containing protein n=1 Tax=Paenibacillus alkalitolerans TaxID=2799335 RepID=UPI0018F7799B|nr:serine hydrolase domain-containing protein [Paenibacillus alkalitolerans]
METRLNAAEAEIKPEEAGYSAEALNRLDNMLESLVLERQLQGASYMLSRDGRIFASRSVGSLRHTEGSGPLLPSSIRRIASITKLFTVVCILRLMEEGKLFLRQPVKDWIEEFNHPMYEKITVYHLLTHTSGLRPDPGYFTEPYPASWWDYRFAFEDSDEEKEKDKERTPEEIGERTRSQWIKGMLIGLPVCQPGESWNYSSTGYSLLGEIIRRASGVHYDEYVRQTIIEPLGMTRTFFDVPDEYHSEVCTVNDWDLERLQSKEDRTYLPPRAGGGLYSTLADLNRFGLMLMNRGTLDGNRILSRKSVELLTRDQFPEGIPAFHWGGMLKDLHTGLGAALGGVSDPFADTAFGHEGAGRSSLLIDPAERLVSVFFVPTDVDWVPLSMIGVKNVIWSGIK